MFSGLMAIQPSPFTTISEILAYGLLIAFPFILFYFYQLFIRINSRPIRIIWLIQTVILVAVLILVFPGFISGDDIGLGAIVAKGVPSGWHSLTYSFLAASSLILLDGFGLTVILSLIIFLLVSLKIYFVISDSNLSNLHKSGLAVLVLLLALHPMNQSQIFFSTRDTLFSLLLFLLGFHFIFEKGDWTFPAVIAFVIPIVVLGDLRPEGKIFLVLFPVILLWLKKWNFRHLLVYGLVCTLFGFVYYAKAAGFFGVNLFPHDYEATAYVLPLSQIFHDKDPTEITAEHYNNVDRVLTVSLLKEKFNPIDIDPFHAGAFNLKATEAEWVSFKKAAFELISENPGIFLKSRTNLFFSMLNTGSVQNTFSDNMRNDNEPNSLLSKYKIMLTSLTTAQNLFSILISSFLPPLLFLIFCLLLADYSPSIAGIAVLFAARVPVLFLLAPANYTKYIYSLFLFFTFVPAMVLLHYLQRKVKSDSVSESRE